ncbi:MAG: hypothetical protein ACI8R9_001082 [Paraglaciecola sp.]|jgi:hypothetical protein
MKSFLITLSLVVISSALQADEFVDVRSLKEQKNGNFKVKCLGKGKGMVSFEESDVGSDLTVEKYICIFANTVNKHAQEGIEEKNMCRNSIDWSAEEAAEFLCSNN